jgi:hypothetical protein
MKSLKISNPDKITLRSFITTLETIREKHQKEVYLSSSCGFNIIISDNGIE